MGKNPLFELIHDTQIHHASAQRPTINPTTKQSNSLATTQFQRVHYTANTSQPFSEYLINYRFIFYSIPPINT